MPTTNKFLCFLSLAATVLVVSACGGDSGSSEGSSQGNTASSDSSGLKDPGERTIAVLPQNAVSETLGRWIAQIKATNARLGWKTEVCNGNGNAATIAQCMEGFVTRQVDAVLTMSLNGPEISKGMAQAKAAKIPVFAVGIDVAPETAEQFDAIYSSGTVAAGKFAGKWIADNAKDRDVVGVDVTQVFGGHGFVQGVTTSIKEGGLPGYKDLRDTDVANLVNSMTQNTQAILQKNPGKLTFVDCCDFGGSIFWPVIEKAGRSKDVQVVTRFDNPSTVKLAKGGANLLIIVERGSEHIFNATNALLEHWINDKPFESKIYQPDIGVHRAKDFANTDRIYPFPADLEEQMATWGKTYKLRDSNATAE